jgi:CRP-like cAMP-binding protein
MKNPDKSGLDAKMKIGVFESGKPWNKSLREFVDALEPVKSIVNLPRHAKLLEEGQMPEGIFVLLRGSVKFFVELKGGKVLILRFVRSGEVLGLSSTISSKPAEYTAETLSPTQFLYVPREDFLALLEERPEICISVVEVLSHQLREAVNIIHYSAGSQPAVEKLADLLELWVSESGQMTERGVELKLPLTQEEIGQMIGVSRETVSRLFADFQEQGVLELEGSRVRILEGHYLKERLASKGRKAPRQDLGTSSTNTSATAPDSPDEAGHGRDQTHENPRNRGFLN